MIDIRVLKRVRPDGTVVLSIEYRVADGAWHLAGVLDVPHGVSDRLLWALRHGRPDDMTFEVERVNA